MYNSIFQPSEGYTIPQDKIEFLNEGDMIAVRFDIKEHESTSPFGEDSEHSYEIPQQYECGFIRIRRSQFNYGDLVSAIIRSKYTEDNIEAILLNGSDTEEHETELSDLQEWRKYAKNMAKMIMNHKQ